MKLGHDTPTFGSLLLSSPDPQRLQHWYEALLSFGNTPALFDKREDVVGSTVEPGRVILNFHCNDARAVAAHLDETGATWLSPLEERGENMYFGTVIDPDGNYVQIIQLSDETLMSYPPTQPFSSFAVKDIADAKRFYGDVLGLRVMDTPMGTLNIRFATGAMVMAYPKPDHQSAVFTIMNFPVDDIEAEIDQLVAKGVTFERYDGFDFDERNIARSAGGNGPDIAWFTDPAGNILSLIQI